MAHYLVTGRGGSGKSTICKLLKSHGIVAFDGDHIPGLAEWQDAATGAPLGYVPDGYIDFSKISWNWNKTILMNLFAKNPDMVLCGSSSNQKAFHELFDVVFVLTVEPPIHEKHLIERESTYGKDTKMRKEIVTGQQAFAAEVIAGGAIPINTNGSPEASAAQIIRYIHEYPRMA
jgi:broad-specificity NMP kinase